ncbi:hypothetical protein IL306_004559 [Fusarium sp. DS 682]|nr:hypothetical protein IL306_004559 [Fusarium sp. DS 682]
MPSNSLATTQPTTLHFRADNQSSSDEALTPCLANDPRSEKPTTKQWRADPPPLPRAPRKSDPVQTPNKCNKPTVEEISHFLAQLMAITDDDFNTRLQDQVNRNVNNALVAAILGVNYQDMCMKWFKRKYKEAAANVKRREADARAGSVIQRQNDKKAEYLELTKSLVLAKRVLLAYKMEVNKCTEELVGMDLAQLVKIPAEESIEVHLIKLES